MTTDDWINRIANVPVTAVRFLSLVFEFNASPFETWWMSRTGGWGPFPWAWCREYVGARSRDDNPLMEKVVLKVALVATGPFVEAFKVLGPRRNCVLINRLMARLAYRAAFVGVYVGKEGVDW